MNKNRKIKKNELELSRTQDLHLTRAQELKFWRFEYTSRKFHLEHPLESQTLKYLLECRYTIKKRFFTENLYREARQECDFVVKSAIVKIHNDIYTNPKYVFDDVRYRCNISEGLISSFRKELEALHGISFQYGYFFENLLSFTRGEDILSLISEKTFPQPQDTFLRNNDDANHVCRFNYADRTGKQYFESERDGHIYLYINTNNEGVAPLSITETLPGMIKKAHSFKIKVYGEKEKATLQICICKKSQGHTLETIKKWCDNIIISYINWHTPGMYCIKPETLNLEWITYGLDSEQLPPQARAVGLWLWDLVELNKKSVQEAMTIVKESKHIHIRSACDDLRQFQKDLLLSRECISAMDVLKASDCQF